MWKTDSIVCGKREKIIYTYTEMNTYPFYHQVVQKKLHQNILSLQPISKYSTYPQH